MLKFLNKCAEIEETAALIYHEFASDKQCDQALCKIWKQMARDEEDHAQQLKLATRLPSRESFSRRSGTSPDPGILGELATSMLAKAKGKSYSLLEMLKAAVVLEKEFRKIHATYALEFKDPGLLKMFEYLARADAEHLADLNAYLKRYKEENHLPPG